MKRAAAAAAAVDDDSSAGAGRERLPGANLPAAWLAGGGALAALAAGFSLEYASLAEPVRSRFGGPKVY